MEEKKFEVFVALGESATRTYVFTRRRGKIVSESELDKLGRLLRREFNTQEERDAYLMALKDVSGEFNYIIADKKSLKP